MPTTTPYALPFPDDEDWLAQGAYAIEQLAEKLAAILTPSHVRTGAGADQALSGSYSYVPLGAISAQSGEWALDGAALTYTGPARWHVLDFEAEVVAGASGGGTSSWTIVLQVSGVEVGRADAELADASGSQRARITVPVYISPGLPVTAAALVGPGGGTIGQARIAAASISPKETA